MKAARQRAIVVRGMAHHLDAGAPAEPRIAYRPPSTEDAQVRRELVDFLAALMDRPRREKPG